MTTEADPNRGNPPVVAEFRANAGRVGGAFAGLDLLLLTTTGARTGETRTRPVAYLADGDRYVVLADNAGRDRHPAWYYNLLANREVVVEVGEQTVRAVAAVIAGAERTALLDRFVARYPEVAVHQARTDRPIPVVALEVCR